VDDARLRQLATDLAVSTARLSRMAARASGSELPTATWRALGQLDEHGPLRVGDLARLERCSQPTATGLVRRLTDAGLVRRDADPDDARATRVSLTPEGRTALAAARRDLAAGFAPRLARLSSAELHCLADAVRIVGRLLSDESDEGEN
jgi:DNA-binding MarR family transcriptional regulator